MTAIDKNNLDGKMGATAVYMDWPDTFSDKAQTAISYFDDTAFLFRYMGRYIVTDEALILTGYRAEKPDGRIELGGPRGEFESLEEVGHWLELVTDDLEDMENY